VTVLRATADHAQAEEWGLVLTSAGVPSHVQPMAGEWRLLVAEADAGRAGAVLEAYEEEIRPAKPEPPREYGRTWAGVVVALSLVAFYLVTGPTDADGAFARAGRASAAHILRGEVWRIVTALTLHADTAHLAGNAVAAVVFVGAVGRTLGPGLAVALVLLAGAGGNAVNAWLHGASHASVGASTAVFGALGILGGLAVMRGERRRAWIPLAGSLALLALLGTGERSDILAHLFGFLVGGGLGVGAAGMRAPLGRGLQVLLGVGTGAVIAGCWLVAFR
jgi:membrane associated rhomboid family serine protease